MSVQTSYPNSLTKAIEGQLADNHPHGRVSAMYNGESSASIPFGRAVKRGTEDNEAILPAAESDAVIGIVLFANQYTKGTASPQLDDTGVVVGEMLNVLTHGVVWVKVDGGCSAGDGAWCRAVAGAGERLGSFENADDGTDTIDCTKQAKFLDTAADGAFSRLEFDFRNSAS